MSYRVLLPTCDCGDCGQCGYRSDIADDESAEQRDRRRRQAGAAAARSQQDSRWDRSSSSDDSDNDESDESSDDSSCEDAQERQEPEEDKNKKRKRSRRQTSQRNKKQRNEQAAAARAHSEPLAKRAPDSAASAAAAVADDAATPALFTERPALATWPLQFAALFKSRPYLAEWFRETPALKELTCSICLAPACDPPNLGCGHLACNACLQGWMKQSRSCPECRMDVDPSTLRSNAFVQRAIWQLPVQCPFAAAGCSWTDESFGTEGRNLNEHATLCKFQEVVCQECSETIVYREMENHLTQCTHRRIKCASCDAQLLFNKFAAHQPAFGKDGDAADDEGADYGSFDPDEPAHEEDETTEQSDASSSSAAAASSSSSSSAAAATSSSPSAAAAASSSSAAGSRALLPPFIPPCVNSEICPRGCEDPKHPGHVSTYPAYLAWSHDSSCPRRLEECTLCIPIHRIEASRMHAHFAAVLSSAKDADSIIVHRVARCLRQESESMVRIADLKRQLLGSELRAKDLMAQVKKLESRLESARRDRVRGGRGGWAFSSNRGGSRGGIIVRPDSSGSESDMGPE